MNKTFVETNNLSSISECLMQLVNAEQAQLDIEQQLEQSNSSSEWSEWRKKAEKALRTVKAKRRLITPRLAVLRQEKKERNAENHQQHNDYLIAELKKIVTPSSFARCVYRAAEKMESANGDYNMFVPMKSAIPAPAPVAVPDEKHSERFAWSYKQWAEHLGGRHQNNDPACYYEFGSFMAVAEMLRQFGNVQRKVGWNTCRAAMLNQSTCATGLAPGVMYDPRPATAGSSMQAEPVTAAIPVQATVSDVTNGKPLTITLPDTSSKAFWSGSGKSEVFHPETYKRWVKEAIERDCCIARIEVKVK